MAGTRASMKNEKQYDALKEKGMSKERAAKIARIRQGLRLVEARRQVPVRGVRIPPRVARPPRSARREEEGGKVTAEKR